MSETSICCSFRRELRVPKATTVKADTPKRIGVNRRMLLHGNERRLRSRGIIDSLNAFSLARVFSTILTQRAGASVFSFLPVEISKVVSRWDEKWLV